VSDQQPCSVKILKNNISCQIDYDDALIDASFRYDLPIQYKCERAICATCLIKVHQGIENITPVSDRERQTLQAIHANETYRLACQCKVRGDIIIEYIPMHCSAREKLV
jgi:ferredoxin